MKIQFAAAAAATLLLAGSLAHATPVVIDFEDQPDYTTLHNPVVYPSATFTSSTGKFFVDGAGLGRDLCPLSAVLDCTADFSVTFAAPVNHLSFTSVADDASGNNLFVTVFTTAGVFDYKGFSDGLTFELDTHDLSAFSNVTGLLIANNDPAGLAFDNFTFDVGGGVPEPAAWALMLMGFGLAGAALRARRAGPSFA